MLNQPIKGMEDVPEKATPPSVVVGTFATQGQAIPQLTGVVNPMYSSSSAYGVYGEVEPKLTFKQMLMRLFQTPNGRWKLVLITTIISFMTIIPILMDVAYEGEYYYNNHGETIESPTEIDGYSVTVSKYTDVPQDGVEWIDVRLENSDCWAERNWGEESSYVDGETWNKMHCERYYGVLTEDDSDVDVHTWYRLESPDILYIASDRGEVWNIQVEAYNEGILIDIIEFLPIIGCMLIPISIIGIIVTRSRPLPPQFVH